MLGILNDRALDTVDNPRLLKIKQRTLWWQYELIYVPGVKQAAVDAFSRRKTPTLLHSLNIMGKNYDMEDEIGEEVSYQISELKITEDENDDDCATKDTARSRLLIGKVSSIQSLTTVITWRKLQEVTQKDPALVNLVEQVERGFTDSKHDVHPEIKEFHKLCLGLYVVDGVMCYKTRLVIPAKLKEEVLTILHAAHQGVSGMTNRV